MKKGLKKEKGGSITSRIARVLMAYRTTPQTTTGMTPSELLQGRRIRTRLDLLKPNVNERVEYRQFQQKLAHDSSAQKRSFEKGDAVFARNFGTGSSWLSSVIQEVTGPVSFVVKLPDGRVVRRHQDHLRRRRSRNEPAVEPQSTPALEEPSSDSEPDIPVEDSPLLPGSAGTVSPVNGDSQESATGDGQSGETTDSIEEPVDEHVPEPPESSDTNTRSSVANTQLTTESAKVYPGRRRKPPERFM